jgi:hypothetical protein
MTASEVPSVQASISPSKTASAKPSSSMVPSMAPSVSSTPTVCNDDLDFSVLGGVLGADTFTCVEVNADPVSLCLSLASALDVVSGFTVSEACCACRNISAAPSSSMVPSLALSVSSAPTVCNDDLDFSVTTFLEILLGLETFTCVEVNAVSLTLCVLLWGQ